MACKAVHWICLGIALVLAAPRAISAENLDECLAGQSVSQAGNYLGSIKLFESCIKYGDLSKFSMIATYRNIGMAYMHAKQYDKAVAAHKKALLLRGDDPWMDLVNLGNVHDEAGDFELARDEYAVALKLNPGFGEAYYNRGISYEHQKKFDKARADFIAAFNHGLRTDLLYERLVEYHVIEPHH